MPSVLLGGAWQCMGIGVVVRLGLVVYGEWQDKSMHVKYTDVDYQVFTDAARYVSQGLSPYRRATYRYTPLLAWALVPNVLLTPTFGKLVFVACDVLTGRLLLALLRLSPGCSERLALCGALVWLLNPLPAAVSSRGNAESVMSVLVLSTLYALLRRRTKLAALVYALSVHVKIYPLAYSAPIYFWLGTEYGVPSRRAAGRADGGSWSGWAVRLFWPGRARLEFVGSSVAAFVMLTSAMYYCYGEQFLEETYLYHVTRRDVRHNFSPYFYMLYLTDGSPVSRAVGLLAFLPQAVLLLAVAVRYHKDIAFCCFVQTFLFVAFNKVCTSQYFLWYLCLLPLVIPVVRMKLLEALVLTLLWFLGQALWLYYAFYLEFEGQDTFLSLWQAGLVFFGVNLVILVRVLLTYEENRTFSSTKVASTGRR